MNAVALPPALLHALAVTALGAALAVVPVLALVRLPPGAAAALALLLLPLAALPLPGLDTPPAEAASLLPLLVLPAAWGLRGLAPGASRVAASLAGPARVWLRLRLPAAAPWLLAGLALGFARALDEAGLIWSAAPMVAAAAALGLWAFATRER